MNRTRASGFSALFLALSLAGAPAQASGAPDLLHLKLGAQVALPLGQSAQLFSFSPQGTEFLSLDSSGLSLWKMSDKEFRIAWRYSLPVGQTWQTPPDYADWEYTKKGGTIAVYAQALASGELPVIRLDANTGKLLSFAQEKRPLPDVPRRVIALHFPARFPARQVFTDSTALRVVHSPPESETLAIYSYSPRLKLLAFKKPDDHSEIHDGRGETVQVYSEEAGKIVATFPTLNYSGLSRVNGVSSDTLSEEEQLGLSPDGRYLGLLTSGRLTVWSLQTKEKVAVLRPQPYGNRTASVSRILWTRDGNVVLSNQVGDERYEYALPSGTLLRGHTPKVDFADLRNPERKLFFSATDRSFITFLNDRQAWFFPGGASPVQLNLNKPMSVNNARLDMASGQVSLVGSMESSDDSGFWPPLSVQGLTLPKDTPPQYTRRVSKPPVVAVAVALRPLKQPWEEERDCRQGHPPQEGILKASPAATLQLCETPTLLSAFRETPAPPSVSTWLASLLGIRKTETTLLWTVKKEVDRTVLVSSDDRVLLLDAPEQRVKAYRTRDGTLLMEMSIEGGYDSVRDDILLSPDERLLALRNQGEWHFYDVRTRKELPAPPLVRYAETVAFVDEGKTLAAVQDSAVLFYPLE